MRFITQFMSLHKMNYNIPLYALFRENMMRWKLLVGCCAKKLALETQFNAFFIFLAKAAQQEYIERWTNAGNSKQRSKSKIKLQNFVRNKSCQRTTGEFFSIALSHMPLQVYFLHQKGIAKTYAKLPNPTANGKPRRQSTNPSIPARDPTQTDSRKSSISTTSFPLVCTFAGYGGFHLNFVTNSSSQRSEHTSCEFGNAFNTPARDENESNPARKEKKTVSGSQ